MKTTRNRKFYKMLIVMVVLAIQLMSMPQMVSAAASVDFAQLSNKPTGSWVNGNLNQNNSFYVEGMSTPQRLILQGLNPNLGNQSITMSYQFTKGGKYAYDFLTSWDQAVAAASSVGGVTWNDNWKWIGTTESNWTNHVSVDVPNDPFSGASRQSTFESMYGNRTIDVYANAAISNVTLTINPVLNGSTASDSSVYWTLNWQGAATEVMVLYAGHIAVGLAFPATGLEWGAGMGAGGISGSPYHHTIVSGTEIGGSRDNQMSASAIALKSGISGLKWHDLNSNGVRDAGEPGLSGWTIWVDLNGNGTRDTSDPSTVTRSDGTYDLLLQLPSPQTTTSLRVYEVMQSGFTQTYPAAGYNSVSVAPGVAYTNINFGNVATPPQIQVTKTANPTSVPEPGSNVTFTFTVQNTGTIPVTITSLSDSVFGPLAGDTDSKVGTVLAAGASTSFEATFYIAGDFGDPAHVNVFTAQAVDQYGRTASDDDDATVTFTDVKPVIDVTKTASTNVLPETGGPVTFTFRITNTGIETVTVTSILDDKFGDLLATAKAQNGGANIVLAPAAFYEFTYATTLASDSLTPHTNRVDVIAVDDDGSTATDFDTETVTFTDVKPLIDVTKTASVNTLPETGGPVTFTFRITNTGVEEVTVTSILDDKFGDLLATAKAQNGGANIVLAPAAFYEFTYATTLSSDSLTPHTNRVDVIAVDDDGSTATDFDTETVTFTDIPPVIDVTKTANKNVLPETGGPVTFTFVISNTGVEEVTVTSIIDDVFGNLLSAAVAQNGGNPIVLAPGASFSFTHDTTLASASLTPHVNRVDVIAVDDDGTPATDFDTETVTFDDVPPQIRVTKTANPTSVPETGADVTFTVLIENIGVEDVILTNLVDDVFGDLNGTGTVVLPVAIPVGGSVSFTFKAFLASDTLTPHINVVTATAYDNDGTPATDDDDATVTFTDVAPTVTIDKSPSPSFVPETGGDVTFTFVITNTGTEAITVTSLMDDVFGDLLATAEAQNGNASIVLDPQEDFTFTITKTLSSTDLADHVNTVTVIAIDNEETTATDSDDATVLFSAIRLVKSGVFDAGANGYADPGELITFTFTVTNPSKIDLTNVKVTDPMIPVINYVSGDTNDDDKLQNGESWIFQGTYPVTQADIDAGGVYNMATATSNETEDDTDDETVLLEQMAGLGIDKQVANQSLQGEFGDYVEFEEGEVAVYRVTVTNIGNITLNNVMLSDNEAAPGTEVTFDNDANGAFDSESKINLGSLAPGESITLYYTYETLFADIARSPIENTATASAVVFQNEEQPNGQKLQVSDSAIINVNEIPLALSAISITKQVKNQTANGVYADMANGFTGDVFTYLVTITNTGDTLLSDVILTDDMAPIGGKLIRSSDNAELTWVNIGGKAGLMIGELEAGESVIYTYQYKTLAADEGEVITNVAAVSAVFKPVREGYEDVPLADDDSAAITVVGIPITGETDNNSLFAGLALILAGVVALILRRRHGHQPTNN